MKRRILVVGGGLAGLAAAWSAGRAGHEVTLVQAGVGASMLASGAVDDAPWEPLVRAADRLATPLRPHPVDVDVKAFASDLGLWDIPEDHVPFLATCAGRMRPARGRDRALLDFGRLENARIALPRADRPGWDADALAASLTDQPFARKKSLWFVAIDGPILRFEEERRIADAELARRHDDAARIGWLADRLRDNVRVAGASAVLLGPWLGALTAQAEALSAKLGLPAGEALVGAGSPAGQRFEHARETLVGKLSARVVQDFVRSVVVHDDSVEVTVEREAKPFRADAVVLAVGGLVSGGIVYSPPDRTAKSDFPERVTASFALSLEAPVEIAMRSSVGVASSVHGPELEGRAWPHDGRAGALESVGIVCRGAEAAPAIYAAGDAMAARDRTVLAAVASGIRAGAAA